VFTSLPSQNSFPEVAKSDRGQSVLLMKHFLEQYLFHFTFLKKLILHCLFDYIVVVLCHDMNWRSIKLQIN
jgi:hypothetical protein